MAEVVLSAASNNGRRDWRVVSESPRASGAGGRADVTVAPTAGNPRTGYHDRGRGSLGSAPGFIATVLRISLLPKIWKRSPAATKILMTSLTSPRPSSTSSPVDSIFEKKTLGSLTSGSSGILVRDPVA